MFKVLQTMMVFLGVMAASTAFATPKVTYGKAKLSGKGCPGTGASFTPAPDGKSFSILFDDMVVSSDKSLAYKDCAVMVPVKLPTGYRLDVQTLDLRGFVQLEALTAAQVGVYPRFMNYKGQMKEGGWHMVTQYGEASENFTETFELGKKGQSFCGGHTQWMIIHNRVTVYNWDPVAGIENMAGLDSVDGAGQIKGKLKVAKCK